MANTKNRLKAPNSAKKNKSKVKKSSSGTNVATEPIKKTTDNNLMTSNDKVQIIQNGKLIDYAKSNGSSNKEAPTITKSVLPIITRSGRIRKKSKDNLKFIDNILKSELMIDDNTRVKDARKTRNNIVKNGANNNNDIAISNQNNNDTTNILSVDVKHKPNSKSTKVKPNNKRNTKISLKSKTKSALNGKKSLDSMEEGLREEVINKMKSVLSPDEAFESELKDSEISKQNETVTNNDSAANKKVLKKRMSRTTENNAKKSKKDTVDKADVKSAKMKQVTLSNGVVLTLALVKCDYCQKSFSNKSSLSRHMLSHVDLRPHKCPHCPRKFRYQSTLRVHLQRRHTNNKEVTEYFMCYICDKAFLMEENLELHLATHVKTENNFKCLYCDKKFSYRLLLVQHEKTHLVTGRFKCYLCDMSYSCRSRLTHHIKTHTKIKEYICQYCGKEFLRLNSIKRHVQVCHGGQRIQCPICMKKLKGHLTEHMRLHEQKRPHVCPDCGQRFTQSTQLTVHRRSHTGVRPYPCRICKRPFGHSNALILHIRRHTGEKPFACAMCPMTFSQLPHMKTHMSKIHGKEKAFKCPKCHEFFKLMVHLETHTKSCTVGDKELSFEEKIQASVQVEEVEIESAMSLSKMRFLLALLLTMIASKDKLKYLGFNKRLIDELLEESLEAMGHTPCKDDSLSPLKRLKTNIEILLNGTVPAAQMEKFRYENKSTEEILMLLTDEKQ